MQLLVWHLCSCDAVRRLPPMSRVCGLESRLKHPRDVSRRTRASAFASPRLGYTASKPASTTSPAATRPMEDCSRSPHHTTTPSHPCCVLLQMVGVPRVGSRNPHHLGPSRLAELVSTPMHALNHVPSAVRSSIAIAQLLTSCVVFVRDCASGVPPVFPSPSICNGIALCRVASPWCDSGQSQCACALVSRRHDFLLLFRFQANNERRPVYSLLPAISECQFISLGRTRAHRRETPRTAPGTTCGCPP